MDKLGINLGFFLFQLLNFGLIFFLLARFVWPRILKMLDERSARIAQGLEDARKAADDRANAGREREEVLRQARAEGQKVIEEARQRGEEQVQAILNEAREEAEHIRDQGRAQADAERTRILGDARNDIVALAIAAAERVVGSSLDEKQQKGIIKDFFSAVPADARNLGKQVLVTSALPLSADEIAQVKKVTGAESVENKVDPSILGGLILRAGDKVVDGSVRGDLSSLAVTLR